MADSALYLITPPVQRLEEILSPLEVMTRTVAVAAVRLRLAPGYEGPSLVRGLREVVQNRDVALLVEDDIAFAQKAEADGVHLTNYLMVAQARQMLGEEANIGANCFASRHAAMEAGEAGADYVSFFPSSAPEVVELIEWWSEMTTLACIAEEVNDALVARRVIEAGADFVSLPLVGADPDALSWVAGQVR